MLSIQNKKYRAQRKAGSFRHDETSRGKTTHRLPLSQNGKIVAALVERNIEDLQNRSCANPSCNFWHLPKPNDAKHNRARVQRKIFGKRNVQSIPM